MSLPSCTPLVRGVTCPRLSLSRRWDGWTMSFSLAPEATTLRLPESDEITLSLDGRWGSVRPRLSIDVDGLRLSGELAGA